MVTEKDFPDTTLAISNHWTITQLIAPHASSKTPIVIALRGQLEKISRQWAPQKLASSTHKFDDALVKETNGRINNMVHLFTK